MEPNDYEQAERSDNGSPLNFGLRTLLLAVAGVAIICGGARIAGVMGFVAATSFVCLAGYFIAHWNGGYKIPRVAIPVGFLSLVLIIVIKNSESPVRIRIQNACQSQMRQLGIAIRSYQYIRRALPPVYTTDAAGKPLHSWRTLMLPYLDEDSLFQQFKLDQPWNSAVNRSLAAMPLNCFVCQLSRSHSAPLKTSYVAVIGRDTVWQPGRSVRMGEVKDGDENTIMLVEMKNSGIDWAEPRDLDWDNPPPSVNKQQPVASLSNHPHGLHVVFVDGHVECLPPTIPPDQFEALLTKSGGEVIDRSRW